MAAPAPPTTIELLETQLDELLRDARALLIPLERLLEDQYNPAVRALVTAQERAARINGAGHVSYPTIRHVQTFGSLEIFIGELLKRFQSGALTPRR